MQEAICKLQNSLQEMKSVVPIHLENFQSTIHGIEYSINQQQHGSLSSVERAILYRDTEMITEHQNEMDTSTETNALVLDPEQTLAHLLCRR